MSDPGGPGSPTGRREGSPGLRMNEAAGRWVLIATILGSGMVLLDGTVVNVALARIGTDLAADFGGLQWIVNAYTLTLAALILLGGSLGDRFGRRRVFVLGTVWFAAASLLCGLAWNVESLVVARALQGVGGALLTPGSLAILSASFAAGERGKAVGAWSGFGGIAAAIGPFLGGWLVEWNWRAVFLINLPFAALVIAVALRHVPESRDPDAIPHFDVAGTLTGALGLGALTYALIAAGERGVDGTVVAIGVAGLLTLVGFVLVERRSRQPLVPLSLFGNAQFTAANLVTFLVYGALGVFFFLLVIELQVVAGFSPILAGSSMLPVTALMLLLSARFGALAERHGPRLPMTLGPLLSAVGALLTLRAGPGASYLADVLPAALVFGLGLSLTVAPLTATVLGAAENRYAGVASGVNNAVARAAGLLAVAVVPAVAGLAGADYTDPAAFDSGFRIAMAICAALLGAGGVVAFALVRDPVAAAEPVGPEPAEERVHVESHVHCGVNAPQLHPRPDTVAR